MRRKDKAFVAVNKAGLIFQHNQRLGNTQRDDRVAVVHRAVNGDWPALVICDGRRCDFAILCQHQTAGVKASASSSNNISSRVGLFMKNASSAYETKNRKVEPPYAAVASR
jgi:hypothetical protein